MVDRARSKSQESSSTARLSLETSTWPLSLSTKHTGQHEETQMGRFLDNKIATICHVPTVCQALFSPPFTEEKTEALIQGIQLLSGRVRIRMQANMQFSLSK